MFEKDYIMRRINNMIKAIASILLDKNFEEYRLVELEKNTRTNYIYKDILKLLDDGDINGAENLLFDSLNLKDKKYIELVLDFYTRVNRLSDKELELKNFSRKEIEEGLKDAFEIYGFNLLDLYK